MTAARPSDQAIASTRLSDDTLRELADTAFVTQNWARRLGFNRERQIEEIRKAFEITLGYRKPAKVEA